jgi:hypothetical protein
MEDIERMLASASMLAMVRQEVATLKRGMVVTDGSHQDGCGEYDVVVRCGDDGDMVLRRLREKLPDADVSRIAEGIVGLRQSRRS